ncbi:sugar phosphate isomerase/epimerase family protein [Thermosulfidibacter takaii]|nr:TIM barrel protein [Thermosulfidibacter takaii]
MDRRKIFVNLPFSMVDEKFPIMLEMGVQPEIYFSSDDLDNIEFKKVEEIKRELEANNLMCMVHAPFFDLTLGAVDNLVRQAVVSRYKSLVPVLNILEPVNVVIHTGFDRWRYNGKKDLWMGNAKRVLSDILDMFPLMTKVAIENVFDEGPDVLVDLISGFDNRVGVCFDVGHFLLFSKASLQEWLYRLGDRIIEFHLHDNDGREDRHWAIGEGAAPVYSLLHWGKDKNIMHVIEAHSVDGAMKSYEMLLHF